MKRSTLLHSVLAFVSLNLLWVSTPALAQHGGGHGGGGGGGHAMGGGGGFHGGGGSYGGYHGGAYGGGYRGGYHGGSAGAYAGRGAGGGAALGARSSSAGRAWSWEGHASRDASPGWHQFASGDGSRMGRAAGSSMGRRAGESSMAGARNASSHAAVADGNWHSFNAVTHTSASVSSVRAASITRSTFVSNGFGWRGGWRGGFGWGWGWPGWNWGGGCCGWGWGWGFGWGWWGPGWSAWGPFWAWPPYYYDPWFDSSWLYGDAAPAPYVLYPYPA